MEKRKFFYCSNTGCVANKPGRRKIEDVGMTLGNKTLCRECFRRGYRLRHGVEVVAPSHRLDEEV